MTAPKKKPNPQAVEARASDRRALFCRVYQHTHETRLEKAADRPENASQVATEASVRAVKAFDAHA